MVRIPIVAGYSYDIDKCGNHTLYYTETREKMELGKNGKGTGEFKEFTDIIGYYSNLEMLLKAVIKDSAFRDIESGKVKCVKDYISSLKNMSDRIETITGGF